MRKNPALLAYLVCLIAGWRVWAQDWQQWRGPNRDGAFHFIEPKAWPEKLTSKWKVPVGDGYAFAQIVEYDDPCHTTQSAEGLLVQFRPDLRTGAEHQKTDRLAAVSQRQHEETRAPVLASLRIAHHRAAAVIDLRFLS